MVSGWCVSAVLDGSNGSCDKVGTFFLEICVWCDCTSINVNECILVYHAHTTFRFAHAFVGRVINGSLATLAGPIIGLFFTIV